MPGLTLKLRRGDRISIGPIVVISCVKDQQDALVLAIEAPPSLRIVRVPEHASPKPENVFDKKVLN